MVTIYQNPRCSKRRETLQILLQKPGMQSARPLMRTTEAIYSELAPGEKNASALLEKPVRTERPRVINADKARIGRLPEAVAGIL